LLVAVLTIVPRRGTKPGVEYGDGGAAKLKVSAGGGPKAGRACNHSRTAGDNIKDVDLVSARRRKKTERIRQTWGELA